MVSARDELRREMPQPDRDHPEPTGPAVEIPPLGSTQVSSISASGNLALDSLVAGVKWGGPAGRGLTLEVSFPGNGATWAPGYGEPLEDFRPLSPAQRAATREALARWAEVANIDFDEVADAAGNVGTLRFAVSGLPSTAWAYYPSTAPQGGDVWLGTTYHGGNPSYAEGTYHYQTLLHEIGHALGLKHPHDTGGTGVVRPAGQDWLGTSLMSYRSYPNDDLVGGYSGEIYPDTPMLGDILAIQRLYGANLSTRAGDTVYGWATGERLFETIWDGGGNDTIDWSNQSSAAVIRLQTGAWSELGPAYAWWDGAPGSLPTTLAIAQGVTIENANGGSGRDEIYGNEAANQLAGQLDADRLYGRGGSDRLLGQGGNDHLEGGFGNDLLDGGPGTDFASWFSDGGALGSTINLTAGRATRGGETDRLLGIENADGTNNADTLYGNAVANVLGGAGGRDTLRGFGGDDILTGGLGNDSLDGDAGLDLASYAAGGAVTVDLSGAADRATRGAEVDTLSEIEGAIGSPNADTFRGDAQANLFRGLGGRDTITGGAGLDRFDYDAPGDSPWTSGRTACDVVTDFTHLSDRLDLSTIDARTATPLNDTFTFLAARDAAFSGAGQVRWYQTGGDTYVEASNDADATPELQIELAGLKTVSAADFVL